MSATVAPSPSWASLMRPGETPEAALRRLSSLPGVEYARTMETDAGQALLREAARRATVARREAARP